MDDRIPDDDIKSIDPWTAAVPAELSAHPPLFSRQLGNGMTLTVQPGRESVWMVVRGQDGGGAAFRMAYAPGTDFAGVEAVTEDRAVRLTWAAPSGRCEVAVDLTSDTLLHWTTTLTPAFDLALPFSPPDVYPLGTGDSPADARGTAHAGQPAAGAAAVFFSVSEPPFGSVFYLQNFSALEPLFERLGTRPLGLVGGQWPQLGFRLPASEAALPAGQPVVVSDAFVCVSSQIPENERDAARLYLDCFAAVYPHLRRPQPQWRDWPGRAANSLYDLQTGRGCLVQQNGFTYARPYLDAEQPDSMVQLALTLPLMEYADWLKQPVPLAEALRAGVPAFYDQELGAVRRYLPDVPDGKDRAESDSWYLYHPLLDLARLAKRGDDGARALLLDSLDHAIRAAKHFGYRWPVKFHLETLDVLTDIRKPEEPGQSDVGGLYAAVMLETWDLTGDDRYLDEAQAAVRAMTGYRFAVGYQFNITAIGVAACLRLWKLTGDDFFFGQSLLLLASFFQHTALYDCHLGSAQFFPAFLGVLCLHDAEYTAVFEAFESFAAFHYIFECAGDALPDSARLLVTEYCRHLLDRAWFYYPGELPDDALAQKVRNGRLDPSLAVPMEDLYPIGDPAGAVGQEVYGAGAAFAFAVRTFRRLPDAPFEIACDYPLTVLTTAPRCAALRVHGVSSHTCRLKLIADGDALPAVAVQSGSGELPGSETRPGEREYAIPGGSDLEVRW